MKILVIKLDAFEQVVFVTPLLRCLHRQRPLAEIHVLTEKRYALLLKGNPNLHLLHVWDENSGNALKGENFAVIIDLQNDSRSRRIKASLETDVLQAAKPSLFQRLTAFFGGHQQQAAEDYFKSVASADIRNDGEGLDFFIAEGDRVPVTDIPHSHHAGFLCIAIGASHAGSKLPIQTLRELCLKIDHPIILIGTDVEAAAGEAIVSVDPIKIYNACGKFTLHESADLVQRSKLIVTVNSEWMQIGAALRKEMVVLQTKGNRDGKTPYYAASFLKRNPAPFDMVFRENAWWLLREPGLDEALIVEKINRRLRKPGFTRSD
jgi:heptosyltransferase-2